MVSEASRRKAFIESVVGVLERFKFDGFDLDWVSRGDKLSMTNEAFHPNKRAGVSRCI